MENVMKHNLKLIFIPLLIAAAILPLEAQATFEFSLQSWGSFTSYNDTLQTGFGIRRARLRGKMKHEKASAFVQFEAAGSPTLLDARMDYDISDNFKVRMGRYIGAGSQAGGRTGHTNLDFTERSIVGRNWGSAMSRSDYRTYGMGVIGKLNILKYEITLNNGDNSINLKPYNNSSSNSDTDMGLLPQIEFMGEMALGNSIDLGASYSLPNEKRINRSSVTGYAYYQPGDYSAGDIRGKFDLAMVHDVAGDYNMLGAAVLGMLRLSTKIEAGGRFEFWDSDNTVDDNTVSNITVGFNYAPNPDKWMDTLFKFDLTYKMTQASGGVPDPIIAHLMWQMFLH